jgi:hypothetical protein
MTGWYPSWAVMSFKILSSSSFILLVHHSSCWIHPFLFIIYPVHFIINKWKCLCHTFLNEPQLFNGDFVDRGSFSVECIFTLFGFKLLYPEHFFMSRGKVLSYKACVRAWLSWCVPFGTRCMSVDDTDCCGSLAVWCVALIT